MRKLVALPVLSADALSSVAYGPQAMLAVLVLAGLPGLSYSLPVGAAIVVLMLAVGVSYRQTIRAYPQGGGSYIVASEELGRVPGLMAAAGLLIDYVMTVAVSIASGVAAITSAYPSMQPATVWIGVGVIVILLAGNLRGVRQAGAMFAVPTYAFIAAIAALVVAGLVHAAGRGFHPVPVRHLAIVQAVTVLLVLRAFASGATAMTGIEAISNAVPSFKPTEWRNARITLSWMIGLLIAMFAGVLVITRLAGIVPVASQTMLSQLAHLSFGDGPVYVYIQAATAAVLLLAANTSYNDFPRVLFLMARDRQAPRSFLRIGDRLTFRNGILLLSVTSAAIYVGFRGNTESLLPLYAVGVFLAFTLSQTGMIMHWRRHRDQPHWRRSLAFNATGAVLSGIVFVIEGVTKFTAGAWVAIVLIAAITVTALRTRRYYVRTGQQLALRAEEAATPAAPPAKVAPRPPSSRPARGHQGAAAPGSEAEGAEQPGQINALTIVPVEVMDRAGLQALAYAAALGQPAFALHISPTAEEADRFLGYWRGMGRPPAARGHRLAAPRRDRPAGQLPLDPARATAGPHADRRRPGARRPALVAPHLARARRREAAAHPAVPAAGSHHQRALPPSGLTRPGARPPPAAGITTTRVPYRDAAQPIRALQPRPTASRVTNSSVLSLCIRGTFLPESSAVLPARRADRQYRDAGARPASGRYLDDSNEGQGDIAVLRNRGRTFPGQRPEPGFCLGAGDRNRHRSYQLGELYGAVASSPAIWLTCRFADTLAVRDRECPWWLLRSGT